MRKSTLWAVAGLLIVLDACSPDGQEAGGFRLNVPAANGLKQALAAAQPAAQVFLVRPERDTVLRGAQGTEVHLAAGALAAPSGQGPVRVLLHEFYSRADMILADLTTQAGPRLLETGGMLHLAATAGGQRIGLRPGATVLLRLPTRHLQPGMQLFEGVTQDDGHLDWQLAPVPAPRPATDAAEGVLDTVFVADPDLELYSEAAVARSRNREGANPADLQLESGAGAGEVAEPADYYEFESSGLGWINCDRFYDARTALTDVTLAVDTAHTATYLVFRDIRSVMRPDSIGPRRYQFRRVPAGARATVVALQHVGQRVRLALAPITLTGGEQQPALRFRTVTPAGLRAALRQLD